MLYVDVDVRVCKDNDGEYADIYINQSNKSICLIIILKEKRKHICYFKNAPTKYWPFLKKLMYEKLGIFEMI